MQSRADLLLSKTTLKNSPPFILIHADTASEHPACTAVSLWRLSSENQGSFYEHLQREITLESAALPDTFHINARPLKRPRNPSPRRRPARQPAQNQRASSHAALKEGKQPGGGPEVSLFLSLKRVNSICRQEINPWRSALKHTFPHVQLKVWSQSFSKPNF